MKKDISIEAAFARLDEIIAELEEGELNLERSLKLYEEATELIRRCNGIISDAQLKIETIRSQQPIKAECDDN